MQNKSVASSHVFVPLESETMNVSSTETNLSENEIIPLPSAVQFFLPLNPLPSANRNETPHSVPDLLRTAGAGSRAALQSLPSSATARRQMTVIAPPALKTSKTNIPNALVALGSFSILRLCISIALSGAGKKEKIDARHQQKWFSLAY